MNQLVKPRLEQPSRKDAKRKADPAEEADTKDEKAEGDDAECKDDEASLVRSIRFRLENLGRAFVNKIT